VKERILIVPMALTMPDRVAESLARFVADGGVLIADVGTGLYDEHGHMRRVLPAGVLAEAAGLTEGELLCSDPGNRPTVPTADGRILREEPADAPLARLEGARPLADGEEIGFGRAVLRVIHTPGHTPDSICLLVDNKKLLAGDTLFVGECGRTDLVGGNSRSMYDSLFNKLMKLNDAVEVYPGHDYGAKEASTIGYERLNNYTLKNRTREEFKQFMTEP
jgi:glyoxylase-like metal-dependent hydrolase (beta-lactamase superfamily II)